MWSVMGLSSRLWSLGTERLAGSRVGSRPVSIMALSSFCGARTGASSEGGRMRALMKAGALRQGGMGFSSGPAGRLGKTSGLRAMPNDLTVAYDPGCLPAPSARGGRRDVMNVMPLLGKGIEGGEGPRGEAARAGSGMSGWVTRSVPHCVSCDEVGRVGFFEMFGLRRLQRTLIRGLEGSTDGCAGSWPEETVTVGLDRVVSRGRPVRLPAHHDHPASRIGCMRGWRHLGAARLSGADGTWRP